MGKSPIVLATVWILTAAFAHPSVAQQLTAASVGLVGSGGSGGAAASGGNLQMDFGCDFQATYPFNFIDVHGSLFIDGEEPTYQDYQGYEYLSGVIERRVRASLWDRRVECYFDSQQLGSGGLWGVLLGSGPNLTSLEIKAFIPYEWVVHPYDWITLFEGDNRGFQAYGGTSRMFTLYETLNPAVNDSDVLSQYNEPGLSVSYDRDTSLTSPPWGNLTANARNDWVKGWPMKMDWDFTGVGSGWSCDWPSRTSVDSAAHESTIQFRCRGEGSNPLLVIAPPMRWDLLITLVYGNNKVKYIVNGCTTYFPSFEVFGNGRAFHFGWDSGNPGDLWYGCGKQVYETGEIQ